MELLYNVYCDESRHLLHDRAKAMVLGALYLPTSHVPMVNDRIREIKAAHGVSPDFQFKWTKVSPSMIGLYEDLIDVYLATDVLSYRAIVAEKEGLDHERFDQTHDEWYYKMYFLLLRRVIQKTNSYRVFVDIKDSNGQKKVDKLREILEYVTKSADSIKIMQQIRSRESSLLQLADLIAGAISHVNNCKPGSEAKQRLVAKLREGVDEPLTETTTPMSKRKMNVFLWTPDEERA